MSIRILQKLVVAGAVLLAFTAGSMAQEQSTAQSSVAATSPAGTGSTADHEKFPILQREFTSGPEVTAACLTCHTEADDQMMHSIHFKWEFDNERTGQHLGKSVVVNSFCGNVAGNEPRCTSCHAGYGWDDMSTPPPRQSTVGTGWDETLPRPTPASKQSNAVDCLACHDRSGQYTKAATLAGHPPLNPLAKGLKTITGAKAWAVDLKRSAQSVGMPGRDNCGNCHFYGGGGDNVKHGDLSSVLYNPTKEVDVHMAMDGLNFTCSTCHVTDKHEWAGSRYNTMATDPHGTGKPGELRTTATCQSCHSDRPHPVSGIMTGLRGMTLNDHTSKVACQTCHIPEFARGGVATKTLWDWSTAGQLDNGKIIKRHEYTQSDGKELHTYLSTKGDFEWGENVVPYYSWFNGKTEYTLPETTIDPTQSVEINHIYGSADDPDSRIWPFKRMVGRQAYDSGNNKLAYSHVWGPESDTAFWTNFDWGKAIEAGMKAAGSEYSGEFGFVDTHMYWPITHMVAPATDALDCQSCHAKDGRLEELTGFYMPGRDPFSYVGMLGMLMVVGTFIGVIGHALLRKFVKKDGGASHE
ncbi:tetrathionate reductase family octaheme c-type cytochrome [Profundibacter sp.]